MADWTKGSIADECGPHIGTSRSCVSAGFEAYDGCSEV